MPWLFMDPIVTMVDHAQSNSKKWPNQIAPNEIFSPKATNKIFMYLSGPFTLQNLKKHS